MSTEPVIENPFTENPVDIEGLTAVVRELLIAAGDEPEDAAAVTVSYDQVVGYQVSGLPRSRCYLIARSVLAAFEADLDAEAVTISIGDDNVTVAS